MMVDGVQVARCLDEALAEAEMIGLEKIRFLTLDILKHLSSSRLDRFPFHRLSLQSWKLEIYATIIIIIVIITKLINFVSQLDNCYQKLPQIYKYIIVTKNYPKCTI